MRQKPPEQYSAGRLDRCVPIKLHTTGSYHWKRPKKSWKVCSCNL